MKTIDIYNFRRNLNASKFISYETPYSVILELLDLKNDIDSIISEWIRINLEKIKYENNKTIQS
jgi:hypothetical protein